MRTYLGLMITAASLVLTGCGGGGGGTDAGVISPPSVESPSPSVESPSPPIESPPPPVVALPMLTEGRLLASNCFQCHGTNGTGGFERITGGEAGEVWEYRNKIATQDIMAAHAQGYTDAQLTAIVNYLNQVP